jgi:hypothetical protein
VGEKEISIDFTELNRLEIYCPKCNTGLLLDMSDPSAPLPSECPACRDDLPQHAITAIKSYRQFFQNAKQSGVTFKFRIKEP